MMNKYLYAYIGWLVGVLAMTATAIAWYAHVERIGARELASRLRATDATEATDDDPEPGQDGA